MYEKYPESMYFPLPVVVIQRMAEEALAAASRALDARRRRLAPKRGLTLRPGPDTPLWNELVRQVRPQLRKHGSKALLARELGVSRQRLQVCLKAQSGSLDAERTLRLLAWLSRRHQAKLRPGTSLRRNVPSTAKTGTGNL